MEPYPLQEINLEDSNLSILPMMSITPYQSST